MPAFRRFPSSPYSAWPRASFRSMHSNASPTRPTFGAPFLFLLAMITALDAMAIDMYLPAFPSVARELGASAGQIQQTLSIFLVGLALGQGLYGPLLDRFGRRWPLLIGLSIFVLGSLIAALAPTVEWLLAARFLQALGAAAGLVAPRAIVSDVCTVQESARVFSVLMQVMMIAPILAPVAGSWLLTHGGWRMVFWTLAVVGALGTAWSLRAIPETLARERRAPLHPGAIARAYAQQCRDAGFMAYTLAGGFILGALFVYISVSPFVLIEHFGMTPAHFSYFFAANAVGIVAAGQLSLWLTKRWGEQRALLAGIALHALAGLALLAAVLCDAAPLPVYLALVGLSIWVLGLVFGNLTALTMAQAGAQAGVASALMGLLQYLMGAVVGALVTLAAPGLVPLPATIMVCGALAMLCCWGAATAVNRRARVA
ncbi:multidrug effflux MFS transporter [Comamonas endophytica]